jgi:hypothetical protein
VPHCLIHTRCSLYESIQLVRGHLNAFMHSLVYASSFLFKRIRTQHTHTRPKTQHRTQKQANSTYNLCIQVCTHSCYGSMMWRTRSSSPQSLRGHIGASISAKQTSETIFSKRSSTLGDYDFYLNIKNLSAQGYPPPFVECV